MWTVPFPLGNLPAELVRESWFSRRNPDDCALGALRHGQRSDHHVAKTECPNQKPYKVLSVTGLRDFISTFFLPYHLLLALDRSQFVVQLHTASPFHLPPASISSNNRQAMLRLDLSVSQLNPFWNGDFLNQHIPSINRPLKPVVLWISFSTISSKDWQARSVSQM